MPGIVTKEPKTDQDALVAYLQTPKKKRRSHVVFAVSPEALQSQIQPMENFVKKNYPQLAVVQVNDAKSFVRTFGRQISLVVMDEKFDDPEKNLIFIETLKEKKGKDYVPVVFLTSSPLSMRERYVKVIRNPTNTDDYCDLRTMSMPEMLARIKSTLDQKIEKKARPVGFEHKVSFMHMRTNTAIDGTMTALSIYGATVEGPAALSFSAGDQMLLTIPTLPYFTVPEGECFRVSVKVCRVFMTGNVASITFEDLSVKKREYLTRLIAIVLPQRQTL